MNIDIYYFTGTGNSYYIAKKLSEKLSGELIPIAQVIDRTEITTDADVIGIVFPVYYGDIPIIVKDFCIKLKNKKLQNYYLMLKYCLCPVIRQMSSLNKEFLNKASILSKNPFPYPN